MFFLREDNQIRRIMSKLKKVKRKDTGYSVFGSSSHKYEVKKPLDEVSLKRWEAEYGVSLPESYRQFLTRIGNGGAGPYYGIYPLDRTIAYITDHVLNTACILHPDMDNEEWNKLVEPLTEEDDITDEEYDAVHDAVLGGMLCIGTQGCEYDMYLVLQGEHRGRIVYTSEIYKDHPFFFTYEKNFLDWYERWLDEILEDYEVSWFGYVLPGDETQLMYTYTTTEDAGLKAKVLGSMFKFKKLSYTALLFLEDIAGQKLDISISAVQLICKTSLDHGQKYLKELLHSHINEEFLYGLKLLNWYGKSCDLTEYVTIILDRLDQVEDADTLSHVGYVLRPYGVITEEKFAPFLRHTDPSVRKAAEYAVSCAAHVTKS